MSGVATGCAGKPPKGGPRRVAVFRALQLGDMLCSVPALRALRQGLPGAEITLVGLPWAREFAARFSHLVDRFIEFPGHPGLPEQPVHEAEHAAFIARMRCEAFDLAIQLHGSGEVTNALVHQFGAKSMAGFYRKGNPPPDGAFLAWNRHHEIRQLLELVAFIGMPASGEQLEFPISDEDRKGASRLMPRHLSHRPYIIVHPGSQLPSRRWPTARFATVAQQLANLGFAIVVTGTAAEQALVMDLVSRIEPTPLSLAGMTTLGELGALIDGAALLVSNDTGVSHIAAALRTPSVIVACGSDVSRWQPLDLQLHRTLSVDLPCRPCAYRDCPIGHPCALGVEAREVLAAAKALLGY